MPHSLEARGELRATELPGSRRRRPGLARLAKASVLSHRGNCCALTGSAALGGAAVMAAQLRRLREAAELPNVTVQVIPYDAGAHPGMLGSFVTMEFPDPADQGIVYIDSMAGDLFLEEDAEIRRYTLMFDYLRAAALRPAESATLLAAVAGEMAVAKR